MIRVPDWKLQYPDKSAAVRTLHNHKKSREPIGLSAFIL
ncbi:hypothetical protein BAGQ_2814 [Bacillus velezensis]|nr:hypothetical protein BCBMB205_26990 [Bacillus velezensis]ARZ59044.1 hypothetical protein BAGQ_2814 [Bacillus velezensis]